jgi:parvulin-like peptidyl-prolyl isomerase
MKRIFTLLTMIYLSGVFLSITSADAPETGKPGNNPISDPNRIIAKVNGHPIYFRDVEKRIDNFEKKFQEINPEMKLPEDKRMKMRQDFLDRMIREKILELAAESNEFSVEEAEIDERISQLQKLFGDDEKASERFLGGITDMQDFRKNVAKQIRIDKFMDSLIENPDITDSDVTKFYQDNIERFKEEEAVEIQQISWRLPPREDSEYVEKLARATAQAEEVMREAQSGRDFTELVRTFSEDPKVSENDGVVGWVQKKQLIQPLEDVVFQLAIGEVSQPIQTDLGIYVIKALDKRETRTRSLDEVRDSIREGLIRTNQGQSREKIYQDLRDQATIEVFL